MIWVLDISNHQGAGFDVARAVGEGYSAIICKASEGTWYRDTCFDGFVAAAQRAGAIPGAYHFLTAGDGAAQARILHARVADHGGPGGWLCAVDCEADASWADLTAFAAEWDQISAGHPLILYTGAWWWTPRGWPGATLTPHLWASRYVAGTGYGSALYAGVPDSWWTPSYGGWDTATLLQFTSCATVAGQSVDVSAFRGGRDDLLTTTGGTMTESALDKAAEPIIHAADVIGAAANGSETTWDGQVIEWMRDLHTILHTICDRPAATVTMTDSDRQAIAAEIASLLAPQLRGVQQLAERLGAAGDALGTLNDPPT